MQYFTAENRKRFLYGKDDYTKAAECALACSGFVEDNEEECISDDQVSCYNCRYRRWTQDSFDCLKGMKRN